MIRNALERTQYDLSVLTHFHIEIHPNGEIQVKPTGNIYIRFMHKNQKNVQER